MYHVIPSLVVICKSKFAHDPILGVQIKQQVIKMIDTLTYHTAQSRDKYTKVKTKPGKNNEKHFDPYLYSFQSLRCKYNHEMPTGSNETW